MKKFNYVGPINKTGYGVASTGYLNQLCQINPSISVLPIGQVSSNEVNSSVLKCITNPPDYSAPTFCFWHIFDIPKQLEKFTGKKIGYSTFEIDTLNPNEVDIINSLDGLATASKWGKSILNKYTSKDITVIPHAFKDNANSIIDIKHNPKDTDLFKNAWNNLLSPDKIQDDEYILSMIGKWEFRKSYIETITAAHQTGLPITLVMFCHNPFIPDGFPYSFINSFMAFPVYTNSGIKVYRKNNLRIIIMPPTNTRTELLQAVSKTHLFLSPSKAEGWNLPLFEAMSIGMPCITTDYSGHTEYVDETNCILTTNKTVLEPAIDSIFFDGRGNWLKVDSIDLQKTIFKALTTNITQLVAISEAAKRSTSRFTWQNGANQIQGLMNQY